MKFIDTRTMIDEDDRKNQTIRSGVAVVICQLFMQLPQPLFEMSLSLWVLSYSYLPGLTQSVVLLLKQKMQSDRDEARKTCEIDSTNWILVSQLLNLLGVKYFNMILSQMQHTLTEGNQLFVLSYTLADLVKAIKSSVVLTVRHPVTVSVR